MAGKGKCCGFFGWLLWTSLVFSGGYVAGDFGPPAHEVLANVGVHVHHERSDRGVELAPHQPAEPRTHEDEVRALFGRVGEYIGLLNTRIEEQEASLKESETSAKILLAQGEAEDSHLVGRLRREQDRIDGTLDELRVSLDEALALEMDLARVLEAAAEVDASYVAGSESLDETRALLGRLDLMGLGNGLGQ